MPYTSTVDVNMRDVMRRCEITATVNVHRDWRIRLGLWIATLGLRLTGLCVRVEDEL